MDAFWSGLLIAIGLVSFNFLSIIQFRRIKNRNQARRLRESYEDMVTAENEEMNNRLEKEGGKANKLKEGEMRISQLWIYPIKSLRGCQVPSALLTKQGFHLDRHFMLLRNHGGIPRKLENMAISRFSEMALFHTSIVGSNLVVGYRRSGSEEVGKDVLEIPLEIEGMDRLERVDVVMHGSPMRGFEMGEGYNGWFSERFGFDVILVYWGGNSRSVLGDLPTSNSGSGLNSSARKLLDRIPGLGGLLGGDGGKIAFNDCFPYLVISQASVEDVSNRLPEGVDMDLTKFRANIVVQSSGEAFEEDYWGELILGPQSQERKSKIILTANCGRCKSLNVDYTSGKSGVGRDGEVLKLLQRDRRVDPGMKYSPIFGRYGFVDGVDEGRVVSVGDVVSVSRRNEERTRFYWPGLST